MATSSFASIMFFSLALALAPAACSSSDSNDNGAPSAAAGTGGAGGTGGSDGSNAGGGADVGGASSGGSAGAGQGGAGGGGQTSVASDAEIEAILAVIDQGEIDAGMTAEQKATAPAVMQFAMTMVDHHTTSSMTAMQLFSSLGLTPQPDSISMMIQATNAQTAMTLSAKTGADFDKAYMDAQVMGHQSALATIDGVLIPGAKNSEVKDLLTMVRAMVMMHLTSAQTIDAML